MKKLLALLLLTIIFSFRTGNDDKKYSVSLELEQWQKHLNGLNIISQQLRQSDLPSKSVSFITDSIIAPLQIEIISQVQAQLPKDSTKKSN